MTNQRLLTKGEQQTIISKIKRLLRALGCQPDEAMGASLVRVSEYIDTQIAKRPSKCDDVTSELVRRIEELEAENCKLTETVRDLKLYTRLLEDPEAVATYNASHVDDSIEGLEKSKEEETCVMS